MEYKYSCFARLLVFVRGDFVCEGATGDWFPSFRRASCSSF